MEKKFLFGFMIHFIKTSCTCQKFSYGIPGDTFQTIYVLLPLWLGGCIATRDSNHTSLLDHHKYSAASLVERGK